MIGQKYEAVIKKLNGLCNIYLQADFGQKIFSKITIWDDEWNIQKERIEKKLSKLETFYDKIVEAAVYLKVENTSDKNNKTIELVVKIPGNDIVVKKTGASFEESLDESVDTAKKLLIKKKELA